MPEENIPFTDQICKLTHSVLDYFLGMSLSQMMVSNDGTIACSEKLHPVLSAVFGIFRIAWIYHPE